MCLLHKRAIAADVADHTSDKEGPVSPLYSEVFLLTLILFFTVSLLTNRKELVSKKDRTFTKLRKGLLPFP